MFRETSCWNSHFKYKEWYLSSKNLPTSICHWYVVGTYLKQKKIIISINAQQTKSRDTFAQVKRLAQLFKYQLYINKRS